jgi:broad specificity phosphatase PhoE
MPTAVHIIRHGQSTFNAHNDVTGEDPLHFDACLSQLGLQQVEAIRVALSGRQYDLVITSPLSRAIQTALGIFGGSVPIVVDAMHREWVNWSCDIGRPPAELSRDFPNLDFVHLSDSWWQTDGPINEHGIRCETKDALLSRIATFKKMIVTRKEDRIAVVGHGEFFYHLVGRQLQNCELVEWNCAEGLRGP